MDSVLTSEDKGKTRTLENKKSSNLFEALFKNVKKVLNINIIN